MEITLLELRIGSTLSAAGTMAHCTRPGFTLNKGETMKPETMSYYQRQYADALNVELMWDEIAMFFNIARWEEFYQDFEN